MKAPQQKTRVLKGGVVRMCSDICRVLRNSQHEPLGGDLDNEQCGERLHTELRPVACTANEGVLVADQALNGKISWCPA